MRIGLFLVLLAGAGPLLAGEYDWVDAHPHYVDFMQETDGGQAMLEAVDEDGVAVARLSAVASWAVVSVEEGSGVSAFKRGCLSRFSMVWNVCFAGAAALQAVPTTLTVGEC